MLIAQEKKQTNIAEYILYMFQLEDIMRACKFDDAVIESQIVSKFQVEMVKQAEISAWYRELVLAMKDQQIEHSGHLAYLTAYMSELSSFNIANLQQGSDAEYSKNFNEALPALTEIVQKSNGSIANEIEAAFTLLYGIMVMRMKGQEVSEGTKDAADKTSAFIRLLVKKYHEIDKKDK